MIRNFFYSMVLLANGVGASVAGANESLAAIAEQGRTEARQAMSSLRNLRAEMQKEQLPLEQRIRTLRQQLEEAQGELRQLREAADSNEFALTELERRVQRLSLARSTAESLIAELIDEEATVVENLLNSDFQERVRQWEDAGNDSGKLDKAEGLLLGQVQRLQKSIGGNIAPVTIYSPEGRQIKGTGLFVGPITYFADEEQTGIVDTSDPSFPKLAPSVGAEEKKIRTVIRERNGLLPIDATGGAALALRGSAPDFGEQILRAGIWIYPILLAAAVAILVALFKWITLARFRRSFRRAGPHFLSTQSSGDETALKKFLDRQPGSLRPFWETLWKTRDSDPDTREDLLYARLIEIRLLLTRGLAALSVIAATAPLLGLLGTVTGMITTFQRITLFGTGDPQNLSGGISEALLTTKFGLIVAIPTFLIYAYLSRRAQGTVADLESFSRRLEEKEAGKPGES